MKKVSKYSLERRMVECKEGFLRWKMHPMWCIVEYGSYQYIDYTPYDSKEISRDYEAIIFSTHDLEEAEIELANFCRRFN